MKLQIGCTLGRHAQLGIDAVINARGGLQALNDLPQEQIEMERDARNIGLASSVRFYQFNSRFFRRHQGRVAHLLSRYDD